MKRLLIVMLVLSGLGSGADSRPCAVIHPTPNATNNEDETGPFLNGVNFKCPTGMKVVDAKHLFKSGGMTYQEVFNASAQAECR